MLRRVTSAAHMQLLPQAVLLLMRHGSGMQPGLERKASNNLVLCISGVACRAVALYAAPLAVCVQVGPYIGLLYWVANRIVYWLL